MLNIRGVDHFAALKRSLVSDRWSAKANPYQVCEPERVRPANRKPIRSARYVLYWMQAAQRAEWNPALTLAIALANERNLPVVVGFGLTPNYPEANLRHYAFMLEGLREVRKKLAERRILFVARAGNPPEIAPGTRSGGRGRGHGLRVPPSSADLARGGSPESPLPCARGGGRGCSSCAASLSPGGVERPGPSAKALPLVGALSPVFSRARARKILLGNGSSGPGSCESRGRSPWASPRLFRSPGGASS